MIWLKYTENSLTGEKTACIIVILVIEEDTGDDRKRADTMRKVSGVTVWVGTT